MHKKNPLQVFTLLLNSDLIIYNLSYLLVRANCYISLYFCHQLSFCSYLQLSPCTKIFRGTTKRKFMKIAMQLYKKIHEEVYLDMFTLTYSLKFGKKITTVHPTIESTILDYIELCYSFQDLLIMRVRQFHYTLVKANAKLIVLI